MDSGIAWRLWYVGVTTTAWSPGDSSDWKTRKFAS
jgi:hypothetical protein